MNDNRTETVAFRTTPDIKALVSAAAARRGVLPSDVLRDWTREKVVEEFGEEALPAGGSQGDGVENDPI